MRIYSFIYHIKTIVFVLLFLGFTINTNGQSDCGSFYSDETIENISLTNSSGSNFPLNSDFNFGINIDCIEIENVECAGQNGDINIFWSLSDTINNSLPNGDFDYFAIRLYQTNNPSTTYTSGFFQYPESSGEMNFNIPPENYNLFVEAI